MGTSKKRGSKRPAGDALIGWPVLVSEIDRGEHGMFKGGLWQKTIVWDSVRDLEIPIPDGVKEIRVRPLYRSKCSFRFLVSEFPVNPGSSFQIDVYPR